MLTNEHYCKVLLYVMQMLLTCMLKDHDIVYLEFGVYLYIVLFYLCKVCFFMMSLIKYLINHFIVLDELI